MTHNREIAEDNMISDILKGAIVLGAFMSASAYSGKVNPTVGFLGLAFMISASFFLAIKENPDKKMITVAANSASPNINEQQL